MGNHTEKRRGADASLSAAGAPGPAAGKGSSAARRYAGAEPASGHLLPDELREGFRNEVGDELGLIGQSFIVAMRQVSRELEAVNRGSEELRYMLATIAIGAATPFLSAGVARVSASISKHVRAHFTGRRLAAMNPKDPSYQLAMWTRQLEESRSPALKAVDAHFAAQKEREAVANATSRVRAVLDTGRKGAAKKFAKSIENWDHDDFLMVVFKAHQDWISECNIHVQRSTRDELPDGELLAYRMAYDHSAHPPEAFAGALLELCQRFKNEVAIVGEMTRGLDKGFAGRPLQYRAVKVWKIDPGEPRRDGVALVRFDPKNPTAPAFERWIHRGMSMLALDKERAETGEIKSYEHSAVEGLDWGADGSPLLEDEGRLDALQLGKGE